MTPRRAFTLIELPAVRRRGFTLIELLVVVAIIVALLAILMPSLGRAMSVAQAAQCASNQRQLGLGVMYYATDHKFQMMPIDHTGDRYWFHLIAKYLGDPAYRADPAAHIDGPMNVMHCPATQRNTAGGAGHATLGWRFQNGSGGYGLNLWFTPNGVYTADTIFDKANYFHSWRDVRVSSETPVLADSTWVGGWPDDHDDVPADASYPHGEHQPGRFMGRFCVDRHDRAVNVAFHDGSARRVTLAELWQIRWHKNFQPDVGITVP